MNVLKRILLSVVVVTGLVVAPVFQSSTALAEAPAALVPVDTSPKAQLCGGSGGVWDSATKICTNADSGGSLESYFKIITNILLFVIGAISVVMIIVGGIKYVVSGGDQKAVTDAKSTIMYAVVGLVISIMAYAIVNFVLSNLK